MNLLNEAEKELLKIILESNHSGYTYSGTIEKFPEYIKVQIKRLFKTLEIKGCAAKTYCWLNGSWEAILTPKGTNYFEKEEESKKMNNNSITIKSFNVSSSNINFGIVNNSNTNIEHTFKEIDKKIDDEADDEDKEELKNILQELKQYINDLSDLKSVKQNKNLFKKMSNHLNKYNWFYQSVMNIIGNTIINIMKGN